MLTSKRLPHASDGPIIPPPRVTPRNPKAELMADVHEMSILELADTGEIDLALAALRLASEDMDDAGSPAEGPGAIQSQERERRSASVERRIHALSALRSLHGDGGGGGKAKQDHKALIPPDYYGPLNISRQKRRDDIGRRLADSVPVVPPSRLVCLLQQAVKWQAHTGQLPTVRELWLDGEGEEDNEDEAGKGERRKRSKRKRQRQKRFDLVLGEVDAVATLNDGAGRNVGPSSGSWEKIPSRPYSTVRFGKKSRAECAAFLPDGSGLVTASSDGFVEIWDPDKRYSELRTHDLEYQKNDEPMMHDASVSALAISNDGAMLGTGDTDGAIKVWKVDNGRCLRKFDHVHGEGGVTCLSFSPDASHVLSGGRDGTCREFGLRASRMLKEFRGHSSYVNTCHYVLSEGGGGKDVTVLLVVTGSADGTVRIWDGRTAEVQHVLQPTSVVGGSAEFSSAGVADIVGGRSIHTILPLRVPQGTMIVVPRCPRAFLVTYSGTILRSLEGDASKGDEGDFVTAVVSPSNKWLYASAENGLCYCFDLTSGKIERTIRNFAEESTGGMGGRNAEVTGIAHHPHKGMLAAFSNEKAQKRGLLTLWK